jgi:hypothetical protein
MIPTFDCQSNPRQFLMSFEAAVISRGRDETTLAESLVMAIKGLAQQWYSSLKEKSIHHGINSEQIFLLTSKDFNQLAS